MKSNTELVCLNPDLFQITENIRKNLGMSRSGFYRYCILRTLDSMSVLSARAKQSMKEDG
ncbi:hypothetical protein ACFLQ6_04925 [Thermoproteota archaeon]